MKNSFIAKDHLKIFAPGRMNLLGEHVDYNAGVVMPAAIDRYAKLSIQTMDAPLIQLIASDFNQAVTVPIAALDKRIDDYGNPLPAFALYPAGVAWSLIQEGLEVKGIKAEYSSNIPIGSGLSSSAAIEVAFASAWQEVAGWEVDRMKLAQICQRAENEYVGVQSGLMDQFASIFGIKDHLLVLDTRTLNWEAIKLPPDVSIVLADSKLPRSLAGSGYNERRRDCESALKTLQTKVPHIHSLRDIDLAQFELLSHLLTSQQQKRVRFVIEEIARVFQGIDHLKNGDLSGFGQLMVSCHSGLRDFYEVSCKELDLLVEIATSLKGCFGARLTGAGFGGCTVNLVESSSTETFCNDLSRIYHQKKGKLVDIYVCHASVGVKVIGES